MMNYKDYLYFKISPFGRNDNDATYANIAGSSYVIIDP